MPKPLYYVARLAAIGLDFFPVARVPGEVTTTTIAVTGSDDPTLRFDLTAYASEDPASGARSNVVELHRGPRPPEVHVTDNGASVLVSWLFRWPVLHLLVERRIVTFAGPSDWRQVLTKDIEIGGGIQIPRTYEDRDLSSWQDGARLEYRVTGKTLYLEGSTTIASSAPGKPFTPTGLAAVWDGTMIRLNWTYPGIAPLDFSIVRKQPAGNLEADIRSPANGFEEAASDPGVWHYELTARVAGTSPLEARSRSDTVATDVLVADTRWRGVLAASLVRMPRADVTVRNDSGHFGLLRRGWCCSLTAHAPNATDWSSWSGVWQRTSSTDPLRASAAPLSFDPAGALHVFYEVLGLDNPGSSFHVHHRTWSASTDWTDEEVARTFMGDSMPAISTVDATGTPQFVWANTFFGDPPFGWAHRSANGTWTAELITAGASYVRAPLATDPDGQPAFVTSDRSPSNSLFSSPLTLVRRAASGAWAASSLADVSLSGDGPSSIVAVFAPTSTRSVVVYTSPAVPDGRNVWVREYDGTQWSQAELALGAHPGQSFAASLSADGKRLAVTAGGGGAPILRIRDATGWSTVPLAPSFAGVSAGSNPGGSLWILQGLELGPEMTFDAPAQDRVTYVLYEL
jgi:hypothetical protein